MSIAFCEGFDIVSPSVWLPTKTKKPLIKLCDHCKLLPARECLATNEHGEVLGTFCLHCLLHLAPHDLTEEEQQQMPELLLREVDFLRARLADITARRDHWFEAWVKLTKQRIPGTHLVMRDGEVKVGGHPIPTPRTDWFQKRLHLLGHRAIRVRE